MGSCKPHDYTLLRFPIDPDPKSCQISQKNTRIRFGDPLPPFVNNKDVADLKPPKTRDDSFFRFHSDECVIGSGVLLILKCPAGGNRCIEHERHQYLRPLWFSKTSKCLSGRQLYFLHNSLSRCSFFYDTARHSLFDPALARCPGVGEPGPTASTRRAAAVREQAP